MQPRIVVVMGEEALEDAQRPRAPARATSSSRREGEIQRLTPTIDALYVPDIDDSLDEESAKRASGPPSGARRLVRRPAAVLALERQAAAVLVLDRSASSG